MDDEDWRPPPPPPVGPASGSATEIEDETAAGLDRQGEPGSEDGNEVTVEETERMLGELREEDRRKRRALAPRHEADPSGRGGPGLQAFARSDLAGRSPQSDGRILKAARIFRRVTQFAGTWTGGPRVDLIRKRVVKDINTGEILLDETIDQTDPDVDLVRPLPCVDGTRKDWGY